MARKVEAPFLETWYGQNSRFEMGVQNKRGNYTPGIGTHAQSLCKVHLLPEGENELSIYAAPNIQGNETNESNLRLIWQVSDK